MAAQPLLLCTPTGRGAQGTGQGWQQGRTAPAGEPGGAKPGTSREGRQQFQSELIPQVLRRHQCTPSSDNSSLEGAQNTLPSLPGAHLQNPHPPQAALQHRAQLHRLAGTCRAVTPAHKTPQSSCISIKHPLQQHSQPSFSKLLTLKLRQVPAFAVPQRAVLPRKLNLHPNSREMFAVAGSTAQLCSGCTSHRQVLQGGLSGVSSTEIPDQHHQFLI